MMSAANRHVQAIESLIDDIMNDAKAGDVAYYSAGYIADHVDALAKQLAEAEARYQTPPDVWAVIELDYDDYPVGAPLSYHWTEQGAKDWAWQYGPRHPARSVVVRTISINGDLTIEKDGKA